jgi:hypothetical protein
VSDAVLEHHPLAPIRQVVGGGRLPWRQVVGWLLMIGGAIAVLVAWHGISGTVDPGEQMPYLASGGLGGAAAIAIGAVLLIACEHARDRAALGLVLQRIDELERRLDRLVPAE